MKRETRIISKALSAVAVLGVAGCNNYGGYDTESATSVGPMEVDIVNADDTSETLGTVTFMPEEDDGVVALFKIAPNDQIPPGRRAIHVHEKPSCEPEESLSGPVKPAGAAGGHYNPTNVGHGEDDGPHAGDSDNYNYLFDEDGSFFGEVRFSRLSFFDQNSLFANGGTSIVIHEGTDDKRTNPSGDSGSRVACGVIGSSR